MRTKEEIEAVGMDEFPSPLPSPLEYQTVLSSDCRRLGSVQKEGDVPCQQT